MRGYLSVPERSAELLDELQHAGARLEFQHDRLVLTSDGPKRAAWASNVWYDVERIEFASVSRAVAELKARHDRWAFYSAGHHRRGSLIAAELEPTTQPPLVFGTRPPQAPLGSFTLLEPHVMLASPRCSSHFANGEVSFVEDMRGPPSRAYLKLWELFTLSGRKPRPGETCLDLGGSPGGWTWVLATLGAKVESVDKAPLHPRVAQLPGVRFTKASAFAIDPARHEKVDWLFSDVICYPERLLSYVHKWLELDKASNLVCTLKYQGVTNHAITREFAKIPKSRLVHLHHNKHELTWFRFA